MTYSAKIVDKYDEDLGVVKIGFREGFGLSKTTVLVAEDDKALIQVVCYTESDDYHFRSTVKVWKDNVVVGLGHRLFIMDIESKYSSYIDLDSYFSDFYPTQNLLLITSGMHLHAVDNSGEIVWVAKVLGIDGVVIDEVRDDKVYGQGEMDPPNGWKPFVLNLDTGTSQ